MSLLKYRQLDNNELQGNFQLGMLVICEYAKTRIAHIFPHMMAFSESHVRKLCRICKNLHLCRIFPHMRSHFLAFSVSSVVLRLLNILAANDYWYLQLDVE